MVTREWSTEKWEEFDVPVELNDALTPHVSLSTT